MPAGIKDPSNVRSLRRRMLADDPLLPVGIFRANDRFTLEKATRRNGSKEPRLGKLTLADARPRCRLA
jgi:hypothetical protein